jgi:hypothetical protein
VKCRFTPDELCRILDACGKAGVASLKWGDLEVNFVAGQQAHVYTAMPLTQAPDGPMSEQESESVLQQSLEEQLSQLMIDDPKAYEEHMLRKDMEDGE